MRIFEQILLQTRQKFAGILGVWQEFLTQYAAKFAEKTQTDAYAHKLLTISCLSFGRFYTIYTITAPNAADLHTLECTGFTKAVQKGVL